MRFIAPLAILSSSAATSTGGGITPEDGHKVVADTLIQRCEKLLEEMKEEARKTAPQGLQMKMAKLMSDYVKFDDFRNLPKEVRDELRPTIEPSFKAVWRQFDEMGGDEKFPMMRTQYKLYNIVNEINGFAQMSPNQQFAHMWWLRLLGKDYPAGVKRAQGIEGLDRADFAAAGETLRQLQAQYPQSLN